MTSFQAAAATLLQVAANPKRLGAGIGGLMVLHTWGQRLQHHPHIHCVVPMGGVPPDGPAGSTRGPASSCPSPCCAGLSGQARRRLPRGISPASAGVSRALAPLATEPAFRAFLRSLSHQAWVVYAKPPFGSPAHVLQYLARYTHRVAISNHRFVAVTDDTVTFRWKDYQHGIRSARSPWTSTTSCGAFSCMCCRTLRPDPLLRLPRLALAGPRARPVPAGARCPTPPSTKAPLCHAAARTWPCPRCGGPMRVVERLTARQLVIAAFIDGRLHDTS